MRATGLLPGHAWKIDVVKRFTYFVRYFSQRRKANLRASRVSRVSISPSKIYDFALTNRVLDLFQCSFLGFNRFKFREANPT